VWCSQGEGPFQTVKTQHDRYALSLRASRKLGCGPSQKEHRKSRTALILARKSLRGSLSGLHFAAAAAGPSAPKGARIRHTTGWSSRFKSNTFCLFSCLDSSTSSVAARDMASNAEEEPPHCSVHNVTTEVSLMDSASRRHEQSSLPVDTDPLLYPGRMAGCLG
jgi:hypothetical protein